MMNREYIQMLYDYNYWANARIWQQAEKLDTAQLAAKTSPGMLSLQGTLVHILSAEWIWLMRWQGVSPDAMMRPDELATLAALRARWREEEDKTRVFLATLDDAKLQNVIQYKNLRGEALAFPLWQMMAHLANHGTQHRAEAAAMLTDFGNSPGDLDFILYCRERAGK